MKTPEQWATVIQQGILEGGSDEHGFLTAVVTLIQGEAWNTAVKANSPVTDNPKEDAFYEKVDP